MLTTHRLRRLTRPFQALLCVADDGGIYPYTVDGELLPWQASLGAECAAQGVAAARVWPTGLVALTRTGQLFVVRARCRAECWQQATSDTLRPAAQVTHLSEALRVTTLDVPPLEATPHALAGAASSSLRARKGVQRLSSRPNTQPYRRSTPATACTSCWLWTPPSAAWCVP